MKLNPKQYDQMVKKASPPSPVLKDCLWAFFVGGGICLLGEVSVILRGRPGRMPEGAGFALQRVKDADGLILGVVTDAYVNPCTFRVTALEISLGLVEELTCGRMLARAFAVSPVPGEPGQVILPRGSLLERAGTKAAWREVEQ